MVVGLNGTSGSDLNGDAICAAPPDIRLESPGVVPAVPVASLKNGSLPRCL